MEKKLQGLLILIICMTFAGLAFAKKPIDKDPLVVLGKLVYEDPAFSAKGNQSCQSCHHPKALFSDPENRISPMYRPVSEGSHDGLFGGRNAPPAAYAAYSPIFNYDAVEGLFIGGLFWDGRATGLSVTDTGGLGAGATGDPLADQAKGPFGNPVEMALPDPVNDVVTIAMENDLIAMAYSDAFPGDNLTDNGVTYNNIALAIAAFEKSSELNRFKTPFDRFRDEQSQKGIDISTLKIGDGVVITSNVYTPEEIEGFRLFNTDSLLPNNPEALDGGGGCFLCHPTENLDAKTATVFTDFSFDNLGVPVNPIVALLAGFQETDNGLGARVAELEEAYLNAQALDSNLPDWDPSMALAQNGKFKVSSLRNVARTAPYGHNGFFPTLYDIVHFYNTSDIRDGDGFREFWPEAEVPATVNTAELGDLGLSFEEEQKIVVFLETLTDDK